MKKSYIEPQNTIITLKSRVAIMGQSELKGGGQGSYGDSGEAREVVDNPDESEDWGLWK